MTNFTDTSNLSNLVGLWDFRDGATTKDTGLADGIAQNGHFEGDAFAAHGQLRTDGHGDFFDVSGKDHPFDLPRGTIEVQFTQAAHKGTSPDTVVNRGEFCDADKEGYFGISVTLDGKVQVEHIMSKHDGGAKAILSTDKGFFAPGDTLNVVYSWDEHEGATFTVENLSKGTSTTIEAHVTGLTLDVGDNDDENFTFGAREIDDGHYDEFFKGAIDYVAVFNKVIEPIAPTGPDFIVEGTSGADLIDAAYTGDPDGDMIDAGDNATGGDEDLVDAGAGNDTVLAGAGDDTVYAGPGDDSVDGGAGDDVIYGDDQLGGPDLFPDWPQDISNVVFYFDTDGDGTFDRAVKIDGFPDEGSAKFISNDLDDYYGQLLQFVQASDPSLGGLGPVVGVSIKGGTQPTQFFSVQNDGNGPLPDDGPTLNTGPGPDLVLNYSDFFGSYDPNATPVPSPDAGPDGNDTLLGGSGDDTIFGQGGDDLVYGNSGNDSIVGGDGNDTLIGGDGDDTVLGGEGDDILRGNEGNDFLDGGAGNDSMGGAEGDDTLFGGAGDDTISGGSGDDVIDGGSGNDILNGGSGNDSITALEGNNTINAGVTGTPDRGFPFFGLADSDPNDDRDTVLTGFGDDIITTGDDNDVITSLGGNNTIDAGYDDDSITTGDGDDFIISGEGSDTVFAGGGNDTIYGGLGPSVPDAFNVIDFDLDGNPVDPITDNGRDFIDGGDGDDLIFGEDDDDTIYGGAGNDTLDGGIDNDLIFGGDGDDLIIGGQGADTMEGGFGNDTIKIGLYTDPLTGDVYAEGVGDVVIGGEDPDGKDVDVLDLSGAGPLKIIFDDAIDPTGTPGESGKVIFYKDAAQTEIAGELIFKEIENVIPCFTPGTLIATPRGEVPVESLKVGDRVITRDNGIQEIRWVGKRTLDRAELAENPNFKPILVKKGSLGYGLPERDMVVSPQHRLLIANQMTELYFNETEVLVPAKHLLNKWGIMQVDTLRTTYIHFMFDQHEVVLSNGSWTESFQPGEQTMSDMGEDVRSEIFALFPELKTKVGIENYAAARRSLKAHEAQLLQL